MPQLYIPKLGDEVRTTAIAAPNGGRTTRARVRRVYRKSVQVIYGVYGDRALVPRASCKFIRRGTLSIADKDKYAACCG